VAEFVTLDGVMEAPGGEPTHPHTGWVMDYEDAEQVAYKFEEVRAAQTLLLGRVTYESFAGGADVRFRSSEERAAFAAELQAAVVDLVARYHDEAAPGGRRHRLIALVHPTPPEEPT
jgi:dihydrofolate reductase